MIDLIYFAAGRLQEMGVDGARAFLEVHRCNMNKVRGELAKRPGSLGHDAIKPEGWTGPDYRWLERLCWPRVGTRVRMPHGVEGLVIDITSNGIATIDTGGGYSTTSAEHLEVLP